MRISIIIPAWNEAAALLFCLPERLPGELCEVILADGGSRDATVEIARARGWRVVNSPAGRARQMNTGAAQATGDVLLFLHADTRLPENFASEISRALWRPGVAAGAFRLAIDSPRRGLRVIERLANWRAAHLQMPFGDQAIFLRAAEFRAVGGFPELPIMEDYDLLRRLRRRGRIAIASASVLTSARRWQTLGIARATLLNLACRMAYRLGVSPARIHRWYYRRAADAMRDP